MTKATGAVAPLYSPAAPETYSRECAGGRAGIGHELRAEGSRALWNLYWLSEPRLDEFLNGGTPKTPINFAMYGACRKALEQTVGGEWVADLLNAKSPRAFVEYLEGAPMTHLAPYVLCGEEWMQTIRARAAVVRGLVRDEGNVRYANFGRKEGNVTTPGDSARIMTLALRKS